MFHSVYDILSIQFLLRLRNSYILFIFRNSNLCLISKSFYVTIIILLSLIIIVFLTGNCKNMFKPMFPKQSHATSFKIVSECCTRDIIGLHTIFQNRQFVSFSLVAASRSAMISMTRHACRAICDCNSCVAVTSFVATVSR